MDPINAVTKAKCIQHVEELTYLTSLLLRGMIVPVTMLLVSGSKILDKHWLEQ